MKAIKTLLILLLLFSFSSCKNSKSNKESAGSAQDQAEWFLDAEKFKTTIDGKATDLYRLANEAGMEVYLTNFGAVIPAILVPDREGNLGDVVLGFDHVEAYAGDTDASFGCVVGRYGNRIDGGRFELDGIVYELPINETANNNQLHGGSEGFSEQVWETIDHSDRTVSLRLVSPDGDMGYPGTLTLDLTYHLTDDNALEVIYKASADAPTVLNVTQHSYFNLRGEGTGDILDHLLMINADHFLPVTERMIPTGEFAAVEGTPMDFRTPTKVGERIDMEFEPILLGRGYDHTWVLKGEGLRVAAEVYSEETGRMLQVLTTEPGVQFYTGNFLDGSAKGKSGASYEYRNGLCLETHSFPDSPNQPNFPNTILRPGEEFKSKTVFKFSVK